MSELVISAEARKVLSRWARDDFFVYIRPITSVYIDPSKKHRIYWSVSVEYRFVHPVQKRGEGYDLDEIILKLNEEVPRRKDTQPGYKAGRPQKPANGWLIPDSVAKKKRKKKAKLESVPVVKKSKYTARATQEMIDDDRANKPKKKKRKKA